MRSSFKMNNKGDILSIFFAIAVIAAIGIFLLFYTHIFSGFYSRLNTVIADNPNLDETGEVAETIDDINTVDTNAWDYAFLGIFISYVILIGIFSFSTRISPVFFWIAAIMSMIGLFMGVIFSNIWQEMSSNPEFVTTLTYFPLTDKLLGDYYPTAITFIIVLGLILLFGKPSEGGGAYR